MAESRFTRPPRLSSWARRAARCGASGKRRNVALPVNRGGRLSPPIEEKALFGIYRAGRSILPAARVDLRLWWEAPPRASRLIINQNRFGQMGLFEDNPLSGCFTKAIDFAQRPRAIQSGFSFVREPCEAGASTGRAKGLDAG